MSDSYEFEGLVKAYLQDRRVKEAIDQLLNNGKIPSTPLQGFSRKDLPNYVNAWLAAQQTVVEWAGSLFEIWDRTWGRALGLREGELEDPRSKLDPIDSNIDFSGLRESWFGWKNSNYSSHSVCVNTNFGAVFFIVGAEEKRKFTLGIGFADQSRRRKFEKVALALAGWAPDDYEGGREFYSPPVEIETGEDRIRLDLSDLGEKARQMIERLGQSPSAEAKG